MESKFKVGDRVVILGYPSGRLSANYVKDPQTGANYIRGMDDQIGKEYVIRHVYRQTGNGYQSHYRYNLIDNDCYWIEDWLDFAEPPVNCSHLEIANLL